MVSEGGSGRGSGLRASRGTRAVARSSRVSRRFRFSRVTSACSIPASVPERPLWRSPSVAGRLAAWPEQARQAGPGWRQLHSSRIFRDRPAARSPVESPQSSAFVVQPSPFLCRDGFVVQSPSEVSHSARARRIAQIERGRHAEDQRRHRLAQEQPLPARQAERAVPARPARR